MAIKLANFARSTLALGVTASDVSISVADASTFPVFSDGDYSFAVLENASYQREIVKITARAGNTFTVTRAQDGTAALAFNVGDVFALRVTATVLTAWMEEFQTALQTRLDAMEDTIDALALVPVGGMVDWPTEVIPDGWLERDGAIVSRTTYANLFAAIGTRYGSGDGATTFQIPDHRGEHPRYWDHGAGRDPDASSRTDRGDGTTGDYPGTKQTSSIKKHNHPMGGYVGTAGGGTGVVDKQAWDNSYYNAYTKDFEVSSDGKNPSWFNNVPTGSETRGRNVTVVPIIKWR